MHFSNNKFGKKKYNVYFCSQIVNIEEIEEKMKKIIFYLYITTIVILGLNCCTKSDITEITKQSIEFASLPEGKDLVYTETKIQFEEKYVLVVYEKTKDKEAKVPVEGSKKHEIKLPDKIDKYYNLYLVGYYDSKLQQYEWYKIEWEEQPYNGGIIN